jgi:hypothetical protein
MALTQDQLDKLAKNELIAKLCVKIDAASPLTYCSGVDAVTIDVGAGDELYMPRYIRGDRFALVNPSVSKARIRLDDGDKSIRSVWYADPFSGYEVDVTLLLREPEEHAWSESIFLAWECDFGQFADNFFELILRSAFGHRQRWGLLVGNRSQFDNAPEPGETFEFAGSSVTVTSSNQNVGGIPYAYRSLIGNYVPDIGGVQSNETGPENQEESRSPSGRRGL